MLVAFEDLPSGRPHRVAPPAVAGAWRSELSGTEVDGHADERADVRVDVDPVVPVERLDLEVVERLAASDVRLRCQSGDVDLSAGCAHVYAVGLVGAVHRHDVGQPRNRYRAVNLARFSVVGTLSVCCQGAGLLRVLPSGARPGPTLSRVEMYCADCGCLIERGVRVVPCDSGDCCCVDLPIQVRTMDRVAAQIQSAFATKDLDALGRLLAPDARWGDDDHPNKCRSRYVVATLDRLLAEGVDGTVTEAVIGSNGVAVLLHVQWPNPGEGRGANLYQSYIVSDGVVTEIQRHDDRRSAVAALG